MAKFFDQKTRQYIDLPSVRISKHVNQKIITLLEPTLSVFLQLRRSAGITPTKPTLPDPTGTQQAMGTVAFLLLAHKSDPVSLTRRNRSLVH